LRAPRRGGRRCRPPEPRHAQHGALWVSEIMHPKAHLCPRLRREYKRSVPLLASDTVVRLCRTNCLLEWSYTTDRDLCPVRMLYFSVEFLLHHVFLCLYIGIFIFTSNPERFDGRTKLSFTIH
jgi:hypothetical protein